MYGSRSRRPENSAVIAANCEIWHGHANCNLERPTSDALANSIAMTSSAARLRDQLRPLHVEPARPIGHVVAGAVHLALVMASIAAWSLGWWPVSVVLWVAIAWMDHAALSRLHEAAHGMLFRSKTVNELAGIAVGTLALTPLSVYRHVHTQHHAYLGREKDPEFWPYNLPWTPKWLRLTYAWLELTWGWIFTPLLYSLRTASAWSNLAPARRRRLAMEWCLLGVSWTGVLLAVSYTNTWNWFLVGHLAPAWIAGTAQTVRKFTEHLGRFGETIYDMTRTVVYTGRIGRVASASQLRVEHHGTHHRWPRIPYHKLPDATPIVYGKDARGRIYPHHFAAIRDMLPHLKNPRVGPQWKRSARLRSE